MVKQYWDDYLRLNPNYVAASGDRHLGSVQNVADSPQYLADSLALERRYSAELATVERGRLDADSRLTYDIFKAERELAVEGFTYPEELLPVNPFEGIPQLFARAGLSPANDEGAARVDELVRWTDQAIVNMREGLRRGYTMPRVLTEEAAAQLAKLGDALPDRVAAAAVREKVLPAYRRLHDFLQNEYLPRARSSVALAYLPLGDHWYGYLVRREAGSNLTPAAIHALGLGEVARIHAILQPLIPQAGIHGDAAQRYLTPEELLSAYVQLNSKLSAAALALFSTAPKSDFEMTTDIAVPPAAVEAMFLRDTLPGRHYQWMIQQDNVGLPRFRRFGRIRAFDEGWSLYAASLGEELGLYKEVGNKISWLSAELNCAVGLVVDTGLHAERWTRQQALDYALAQIPAGPQAANDERLGAERLVDESIAFPGRALACKVGELKIQALRHRAEAALGPRFDIRAFHTQILGGGAMPLDILDAKIEAWIKSTNATALYKSN
jgi:uncharacterized protein (DUF885 family)